MSYLKFNPFILSVVVLTFALTACRKDPSLVDECIGASTEDFITVGGTCFEVQEINNTIHATTGNKAWQNIDLNNDLNADVLITHSQNPSGSFIGAWISCPNDNVYIGAETELKTIYNYTTTWCDPASSNPVELYEGKYKACTAPDSVNATPQQIKVLRLCEPDDVIFSTDSWTNDVMYLYRNPQNEYEGSAWGGQDTVIYFASHEDLTCNYIPFGVSKYIPLKFNRGEGEIKLGWIKLMMKDEEHMTIEQVALQR